MKRIQTLGIFLQLIRWKNLLLMALSQFIFYFYVLIPEGNRPFSQGKVFFLLLLSTLFIAAGGYVINAIFDVTCDRINKPDKVCFPTPFSLKSGKWIYGILTALGLIFAAQFSFQIGRPFWLFLFVGITVSLYLYSRLLKKTAFLGNLLIATLLAGNLLVLLLLPIQKGMRVDLLYTFAFFAFAINLIREMVKDLEDIKGDYNAGMRTLPILLGKERSIKLILVCSTVFSYFLIAFMIDSLQNKPFIQVYHFIAIIAPFLYFCYDLYFAKTSKQFHRLSNLLKVILIFGLLLVLFLCYNPF